MSFNVDTITTIIAAAIALLSLFFSLRKESLKDREAKRRKESGRDNNIRNLTIKINNMEKIVAKLEKTTTQLFNNCKAHEALSNTADIEEIKETIEQSNIDGIKTGQKIKDLIQKVKDASDSKYVTKETHNQDLIHVKEYMDNLAQQWRLVDKLLSEVLRHRNTTGE